MGCHEKFYYIRTRDVRKHYYGVVIRKLLYSHTYYYLVFHHPLTLSFQAQNLPSLQILATAVLPFLLRDSLH